MSARDHLILRASHGSSAPVGPPIEITKTHDLPSGPVGPSEQLTLNSVPFGAAHAERWIVMASVGSRFPLEWCTIGGTSATIIRDVNIGGDSGGTASFRATIVAAKVPGGSSGTIVQRFIDPSTRQNFATWVFRVLYLQSPVPVSEDHAFRQESGSPQSLGLSYPVFGGSLAIGLIFNSFATSYTLTGVENRHLIHDGTPRRYCFWEVPGALKNFSPIYTMNTGASGQNNIIMTGVSLR